MRPGEQGDERQLDREGWLTPAEAGRLLGLTPASVRRLCDQRRLVVIRTPLGRLVRRDSVLALAALRRHTR
jgi:hypothetical protein